jgi:Flp pilus assembly protein TadD
LKIRPDDGHARQSLAVALSEREGALTTLAQQRESLRSRPNDVALLNDSAWALATNPNASVRNGVEAVKIAQRAAKLSGGQDPAILATLAAAYAEAGQFSDAVQTARKAANLATLQGKPDLLESLQTQLPLYEVRTPFRDMRHSSAGRSFRP